MSLLAEKLNSVDPFEINIPIFNSKIAKHITKEPSKLQEEFYCDWLKWVFGAELESSIIYPIIAQRIRNSTCNNFLDNLDINEKNLLCDYLETMGREEGEHFDHFSSLLKLSYGEQVNSILDKNYLINQSESLRIKGNTLDPFILLSSYYSGECYFWSAYYLFYKYTHNENLKKNIKTLLVEEAQHNNRIYKIFKNYKDNIKFNKEMYIECCRSFRYLNICFVQKQFNFSKDFKDRLLLNNIYSYDLQKEFNELAIKKWHQLYTIFDPETSIANFATLVNN